MATFIDRIHTFKAGVLDGRAIGLNCPHTSAFTTLMIHQCQSSEASAAKFKGLLEEFYADAPERLKAALYGLTLAVKKPVNDQEQD